MMIYIFDSTYTYTPGGQAVFRQWGGGLRVCEARRQERACRGLLGLRDAGAPPHLHTPEPQFTVLAERFRKWRYPVRVTEMYPGPDPTTPVLVTRPRARDRSCDPAPSS